MDLYRIQPGTKIELELLDDTGEKNSTILVSELEWCEGQNEAYIAAPIHEGILYPMHIGTIMNMCMLHGEELYKAKARVTGRNNKDNIVLLKVEASGGLKKIQRRQFFRFDCIKPVKYRMVHYAKDARCDEEDFKNTITKDISGSGICMLVEEEIQKNALLECELLLEEGNAVKFLGNAVRVIKCDFKSRYKYEIGVFFKQLDNKDRDYIVKYIFNEQRKLRKKGLI